MPEYPYIQTPSGDQYAIDWIGVATIDGLLRFRLPSGNITDILIEFSNTDNLPVTVHEDDELCTEYTDYTTFFGAEKDMAGGIIVILGKE